MFDKVRNEYVPTVAGLGMHVEVRDPETKVVMSRVRFSRTDVKMLLLGQLCTYEKISKCFGVDGGSCVGFSQENIFGHTLVNEAVLKQLWCGRNVSHSRRICIAC